MLRFDSKCKTRIKTLIIIGLYLKFQFSERMTRTILKNENSWKNDSREGSVSGENVGAMVKVKVNFVPDLSKPSDRTGRPKENNCYPHHGFHFNETHET